MISRRQLLQLAAGSAASLALPGCAASPALRKDVFPDFGDDARPYLGLATSLREEYDYEVVVEGKVPAALRGTLYRNGPGLFDRGGKRKRNLLDGDGLIQSFRFHDRGIRYRNRFVRTAKFVDEQAAGRFIYPSWSTQAPGGFIGNFWGAGRIKTQADITVFPWRGSLYAFDECALPYRLDPETLSTFGESRLGLPEGFTIYNAHAKLDHVTGEWLHFGVLYGPRPQIHLTIFAPDGSLRLHRTIPLPRYVYMHDWFASDRHLILQLHPAIIEFWGFLLGFRSLAESLRWQPEKGNLIMMVDRWGDADPVLLEGPPCYMWHSLNAFESAGTIIADFIGYANPDHFIGADPVVSAVMTGHRGQYEHPGELRRYIIDPVGKTMRQEVLDRGGYEWPRINELHRCHAHRIGYMAKTRPGEFFWSLLTRFDLHTGRTMDYDFGAGRYCSEPVFVPIPGASYAADDPSEPGWLLSEVYDSHTKKSFLAILRADRPADGPIAVAYLRHHVPFSYHGWWSAA